MKKGVDYTGVCVVFYCHDGQENVLMHKRSNKCRDEFGRWDIGGGGFEFGEPEKIEELGWFTLSELPSPIHSQLHTFFNNYKHKL